jgi:hypothetical protein
MKRNAALLLALLLSAPAMAAEVESLVQGEYWAAWIKPEFQITTIAGESAGLAGVELGPSLGRNLYIGAGWHTLVGSVSFDGGDLDATDLWYAGGTIGYTILPDKLVHGAVDLFVGGGRASADLDAGGSDRTGLFVVQPTASFMVNLAPKVEFGLGVGYRAMTGGGIAALDNGDLSGATGCIFFRWNE